VIRARKHDQIGAREVRLNHGRNRDFRNKDFFGKHCLDNFGTPSNIDKLHLEAMLLEESRIFRHPDNGHRTHRGRVSDFQLCRLCESRTGPNHKQEQKN
jgi:hypothetical protein